MSFVSELSQRQALGLITLDVALDTLSPAQGATLIKTQWLDSWDGQDHETFRDACKLGALWRLRKIRVDNVGETA